MKNKRAALRMEIKQIDERGSFEGILATYGNVDLGGDLIEPGAFAKTIQERGNTVKLLWQHDSASVIGALELMDGPDALRVKGQIELDDDIPFTRTAYKLLKKNLLSGLSIGYDTIKSNIEPDGVRHLKELRLWEGSLVTFPMNEQAGVTSVKARFARLRKDDFAGELAEAQLYAAPSMMLDALFDSLWAMTWDADMTDAERLDGSKLALGQFTDAWLAWLPAFLGLVGEEAGETGTDIYYMRRRACELKTSIAKESKEGRRLSGATKSALKDCKGHTRSMDSILTALLEDEADDDADEGDDGTSKTKAAHGKPEPARDHSAAETLITSMRSLIPAA
jgi:HK97 family phage prohead protease